jgi:hypothetical protein
MKQIAAYSAAASLCLLFAGLVPATAGEMTDGVVIDGGQNTFARLTLARAQGAEEDGLLRLVVKADEARSLKGYGFVLSFDPARYELVKTREITEGLLNTGTGEKPLFLSSNRDPGQVSVGAMKVDGDAAAGGGALVEFTFKTDQTPLPTDFQITDGILVDLDGKVDMVTSVEIGNLKPMPKTYALDQNMPNPFNPTTTISYQLPESGPVQIVIYNLLGQKIRTLVNDRMDAGFYTVGWDGADETGRQVASGVYIYRMQSAAFSQTQRMMLLK